MDYKTGTMQTNGVRQGNLDNCATILMTMSQNLQTFLGD